MFRFLKSHSPNLMLKKIDNSTKKKNIDTGHKESVKQKQKASIEKPK
eukprot:CAMPEP_0176403762 /NCGR_PEP_ID=MMETSP0126-20121128/50358_1 /TAXON_ID=141414 ORGANISM="Strombidinopsis acuminatum, Strain SPMC142" /NCGR_SAMPLE_ID=MMETSP0126 /ASSEMBLY_ACC=CAM_ASM_000229 /LENGTH=46 /DNA_ID= /DNA_START= /DNA_END= /DNA_ORIENTATION=